jgi:TrmH family RNA methyltransferase
MATRERLKLLASLNRSEIRRREGLYLVEGARLVGEALGSGAPLVEILHDAAFADGGAAAGLLDRAEARGVPVRRLPARDLRRLCETKTPQGIVAVVRQAEPEPEPADRPGVLLVLDAVADPGNVGTLVRAADAFAARGVLAGPGSASYTNGKVLRGAMGSTFHLPLWTVADLPAELGRRAAAGEEVLAATLAGAPPRPVRSGGRVCLVLGNEARGVSPEVRRVCGEEVTIPCPGRAESLNVALAGGILLALLSGRPA